MEKKDDTSRVNWFIIAGLFALFFGLAALPALASIAAARGAWVAALTIVAIVAGLSFMMTETWRHSPH